VNATRPALAGPTATTATPSLPFPSDEVERHRLRMELLRRNLRLPQSVIGWWLRSEEARR